MKDKKLLIMGLCLAVLLLAAMGFQIAAAVQQSKYQRQVNEMNAKFQAAKDADALYKKAVHDLQQIVGQQQQKVDSLNQAQAALNKVLQERQTALKDIKQLLLKPKTSYSDSTAQTILNQLPK